MKNFTKIASVLAIATVLTACGGGTVIGQYPGDTDASYDIGWDYTQQGVSYELAMTNRHTFLNEVPNPLDVWDLTSMKEAQPVDPTTITWVGCDTIAPVNPGTYVRTTTNPKVYVVESLTEEYQIPYVYQYSDQGLDTNKELLWGDAGWTGIYPQHNLGHMECEAQ